MEMEDYLNIFMGVLEILVLYYIIFQYWESSERAVNFKKRYYILVYLGVSALTFASMLTGINDISTYLMLVSTMVIGYIMYHRSFMHVFHSAIFFVCLCCGMIACRFLLDFLLVTFHISLGTQLQWANLVIFLKLLSNLILGNILIRLLSRRYRSDSYTRRHLIATGALSLAGFFVMITLSFVSEYAILLRPDLTILVFISFIMLILFNILAGDLLGIRSVNMDLHEKLSVYQQQSKMQYDYYKDLEEKYHSSRKLIHDIRNHMHAVQGLYHTGETEAADHYAKDIHNLLNQLGQQYYCDHKMLNIILNDKLEKAHHLGIETSVSIGDVEMKRLKDIDVTTIFANLLDNAVRAAQEVVNGAYIHLKIERFHDLLVIHIKNSKRSGSSYEKKIRREGSGIGLKNVESVLKRYDGTLEIRKEQEEFHVNIVIPMEEG